MGPRWLSRRGPGTVAVAVAPSAPHPAVPPQDGDLLAKVAARLGMSSAANEEEVIATACARIAQARPAGRLPTPPQGMVYVAELELGRLRRDARAGRSAAAVVAAGKRDRTLSAAMRAGKLGPFHARSVARMWEADPTGAAAVLEQLPPGTVPMVELGHAGDVEMENSPASEGLYRSVFPD